MSKEYDNTNSGALFKNVDKDDSHPNWADYKGQVNVEGREFWLSAWIKKSKKGEAFMSLSLEAKKDQQPKRGVQTSSPARDEGDSIPF